MTGRIDRPCGCAYVKISGPVAPCWWQVIACPQHEMIMKPLAEVPGD